MKNLLFINACVRGEESRTFHLCRYALTQLNDRYHVTELDLAAEKPVPFDKTVLDQRIEHIRQGDFGGPLFSYARRLQEADYVVVGAPYWDLSFPSVLKAATERMSVTGLTFRYGESGQPEGLCRAGSFLYITTSGGYIGQNNHGFHYIRSLFSLFGITDAKFVSAEGLDIIGADIAGTLGKARSELNEICRIL